jgi:hypothetical protein
MLQNSLQKKNMGNVLNKNEKGIVDSDELLFSLRVLVMVVKDSLRAEVHARRLFRVLS